MDKNTPQLSWILPLQTTTEETPIGRYQMIKRDSQTYRLYFTSKESYCPELIAIGCVNRCKQKAQEHYDLTYQHLKPFLNMQQALDQVLNAIFDGTMKLISKIKTIFKAK